MFRMWFAPVLTLQPRGRDITPEAKKPRLMVSNHFWTYGLPRRLAMGNPDAATLPPELCDQSMHGYCTACQDKPWLYDLDLAPALCSARRGSYVPSPLIKAYHRPVLHRLKKARRAQSTP